MDRVDGASSAEGRRVGGAGDGGFGAAGLEGEVRKGWIPEVGRMRATRKVVKVPRIGPSKQGYHLTVCHVREGRGWELRRGFAQTRLPYAQGETHRDRLDDSDEDNGRTLRELMGD